MIDETICFLDSPVYVELEPMEQPTMVINEELSIPNTNNESTDEKSKQCSQDFVSARLYLHALEGLLTKGSTSSHAKPFADTNYDVGYHKLLTLLKDAGCRFFDNISRPRPDETDICLSLKDRLFLSKKGVITNSNSPSIISKTMELNKYSNVVKRAILFGKNNDKEFVSTSLIASIPSFIKKWNVKEDSQDVLFIKALALVLKSGLAAVSQAITYTAADLENPVVTTPTTVKTLTVSI